MTTLKGSTLAPPAHAHPARKEKPGATLAESRGAASSVHLRVGALMVSGLSRTEGVRLSAAFEGELGRLLTSAELPRETLDAERVLVPRFVIRPGEPLERTGRRLARLVVEKLHL